MQLTEQTIEGWSGVLADLTAKRQAVSEHASQLREQKADTALEAALGSADAKKRLAEINKELARLTVESEDLNTAIARAEQAAVSSAERERQEQIGVILKQYLGEIRSVDDALRLVAARFGTAVQALERAESLINPVTSTSGRAPSPIICTASAADPALPTS